MVIKICLIEFLKTFPIKIKIENNENNKISFSVLSNKTSQYICFLFSKNKK